MRFASILSLSLAILGCGGNVVVDVVSTTTGTTTGTGTGGSITGCGKGRVPQNHRPSAVACPVGRGPGATFPPGTPPCIAGQGCLSDADCTAGNNGRCVSRGFGALCSVCTYDTCASDADCSGNMPCDCRSSAADTTANTCADLSQCRVDADCGACRYCSPNVLAGSVCSAHTVAFFCHTPADACVDDSDCASQGKQCNFDGAANDWSCGEGCVQPP